MPDVPEGNAIAKAKFAEIAALSWAELDAYGRRDETVKGLRGQPFRVKSLAHWDMEEWASGIIISVKVYAPTGIRRLWPYKVYGDIGGPGEPAAPRPTS